MPRSSPVVCGGGSSLQQPPAMTTTKVRAATAVAAELSRPGLGLRLRLARLDFRLARLDFRQRLGLSWPMCFAFWFYALAMLVVLSFNFGPRLSALRGQILDFRPMCLTID